MAKWVKSVRACAWCRRLYVGHLLRCNVCPQCRAESVEVVVEAALFEYQDRHTPEEVPTRAIVAEIRRRERRASDGRA
jgi:hypothetical protein